MAGGSKNKHDGSGDKKSKEKDKKISKTARKSIPAPTPTSRIEKPKRPSLDAQQTPALKRGVGKELEVRTQLHTPPEVSIKKFGPFNVEAKQAQTAVLVLQSREQHVVIEALNCLQRFCKKQLENRHILVALGAVPEIIKLIFSSHQVIQRLAMKILALVSVVHQAKLLLSTSQMCSNLVKLTASEDAVIQEYATFAISAVATLYTGRLELIQEGIIHVLYNLLNHADPDIQYNSAEAIYRVLHEPMNIVLITTAEIIKRFVALTDAEFPALQQVSLAVLAEVATCKAGIQVLESMDIISKIANKLGNLVYEDLHPQCLRILIKMADSATACHQMTKVLSFVSTYFRKGRDVAGRIICLQLIGKLARLPAVAKVLVDLGVTQWIVAIVACNSITKMKEAAIFAASQLAMTNLRAKVRFSRCIKQVLYLLANLPNISKKFREYALIFLSSVLEDSRKCCPKFMKHKGLILLENALDSPTFSNNARISMMACISNLNRYIEYRDAIVETNILKKILRCLENTKNSQLLAAAGNALCGLLVNETARLKFMEFNGQDMLTKLISHNEFPVVVSSVPIMLALGAYPTIGKELVNRGILHALWKRQDLISCNGPLRTAFECILSNDLPSKFAVAGHIEPFEKLENGFYDTGNLKKVDNLISLNNMTINDLMSLHTRVLYLNLTTDIDPALLDQNKILQIAASENRCVMNLIEELRPLSLELKNEKDFVRLIAMSVAEKMGGTLDKWRIGAQAEELEMADIQSKHDSVVVPITMITIGAHRPRAILFKAVADAFGIPCSLERGDYKKSWNVVLLNSKKPQRVCPCDGQNGENVVFTEKLRRYVVDLIHHPGALLPLNSYEANAYCFF